MGLIQQPCHRLLCHLEWHRLVADLKLFPAGVQVALVDLKSIPVIQTGRVNQKRHRGRQNLDSLILYIATLIDPEAFSGDPGPTRTKLIADLAHAQQEIADLREEIDWLTVMPTDPVGEYARIIGERRRQERFGPLRREPSSDLTDSRAERQSEAIDRAKQVVEACRRLLPRQKPRYFFRRLHA